MSGICPRCGGCGEQYPTESVPCEVCGGTGEIPMTDAVRQYREAKLDPELDAGDIMGYADAAIAELEAERDAAVRERDIWRDMYRHSVRPVRGSEMAYEAQMKYDREASRARLYTKQRREETWADSPPIETEDGYV